MIQLTKDLAMTADGHCYIVGQPRQRPDKGLLLDNPTYPHHRRPSAAHRRSAGSASGCS